MKIRIFKSLNGIYTVVYKVEDHLVRMYQHENIDNAIYEIDNNKTAKNKLVDILFLAGLFGVKTDRIWDGDFLGELITEIRRSNRHLI